MLTKYKIKSTIMLILFILFNITLTNSVAGDMETTKNITEIFAILIEGYEKPGLTGTSYYYYDEQPIKLELTLTSREYPIVSQKTYSEVIISQNDWYNLVEIYALPGKRISRSASGELFTTGGKPISRDVISNEERRIDFRLINGEALTEGKIRAGEKKTAIIEIMDEGWKPLNKGDYSFHAKIELKNDFEGEGFVNYSIIKAITTQQKEDYHIRQGDVARNNKDFILAINHYKEALAIKHSKEPQKLRITELLLSKISLAYEELKDYENARKYAMARLKSLEDNAKKREEELRKEAEKMYRGFDIVLYKRRSMELKREWEGRIRKYDDLMSH